MFHEINSLLVNWFKSRIHFKSGLCDALNCALLSQNAVSAYFTSTQKLNFGFSDQIIGSCYVLIRGMINAQISLSQKIILRYE